MFVLYDTYILVLSEPNYFCELKFIKLQVKYRNGHTVFDVHPSKTKSFR